MLISIIKSASRTDQVIHYPASSSKAPATTGLASEPLVTNDMATSRTFPKFSTPTVSVRVAKARVQTPAMACKIHPRKSASRERQLPTRTVPRKHSATGNTSGVLLFEDLSAKWAIKGAEITEERPCMLSKAVVNSVCAMDQWPDGFLAYILGWEQRQHTGTFLFDQSVTLEQDASVQLVIPENKATESDGNKRASTTASGIPKATRAGNRMPY